MKRQIRLAVLIGIVACLAVACGSKPVVQPQPVVVPKAEPAPAQQPAPAILARVMEARWEFDKITGLPPREATYREGGEGSGYGHYAYAGGALRLFLDSRNNEVWALVVDTQDPAYRDFEQLNTTPGFIVVRDGRYTAVVRSEPASEALVAALKAGPRTAIELRAALGEPTVIFHVHGLGTQVWQYVPQGLTLETDRDGLKLAGWDAADLQIARAKTAISQLKGHEQLLATKGKPSSGGQYVAAHHNGGVYWIQYILVKEPGKAERRYGAGYFIHDFFWLDENRLAYAEMQMLDEFALHIVDVPGGKLLPDVVIKDRVTAFGSAGPGKVWYKGKDGVQREVTIP